MKTAVKVLLILCVLISAASCGQIRRIFGVGGDNAPDLPEAPDSYLHGIPYDYNSRICNYMRICDLGDTVLFKAVNHDPTRSTSWFYYYEYDKFTGEVGFLCKNEACLHPFYGGGPVFADCEASGLVGGFELSEGRARVVRVRENPADLQEDYGPHSKYVSEYRDGKFIELTKPFDTYDYIDIISYRDGWIYAANYDGAGAFQIIRFKEQGNKNLQVVKSDKTFDGGDFVIIDGYYYGRTYEWIDDRYLNEQYFRFNLEKPEIERLLDVYGVEDGKLFGGDTDRYQLLLAGCDGEYIYYRLIENLKKAGYSQYSNYIMKDYRTTICRAKIGSDKLEKLFDWDEKINLMFHGMAVDENYFYFNAADYFLKEGEVIKSSPDDAYGYRYDRVYSYVFRLKKDLSEPAARIYQSESFIECMNPMYGTDELFLTVLDPYPMGSLWPGTNYEQMRSTASVHIVNKYGSGSQVIKLPSAADLFEKQN